MLNRVISAIYPERARQAKKSSKITGSLVYPSDLGQHYMHLFFETYQYKKKGNDPALVIKPSDSIALPLPENVQEVSQIRVRPDDIGLLGGELGTRAGDYSNAVVNAIRGAGQLQTPDEETISSFGKLALAKVAQDVLKNITPGLQRGLEAGAGLTFNPYQTLTFDGVNLKEYVFDWTLAPSTRNETSTLNQIINTIKQHIHPAYGGGSGITTGTGRAFLKYPDILYVRIYGSKDYLPSYKPAMVSNFTVNYVGGGEMAFLEGGAPAAVKITMSITEMEIWTQEDYDGSSDYGGDGDDTGNPDKVSAALDNLNI